MFKFNLGDELKDEISGFKGIVVARIEYLTGCEQYQLQPRGLNKEKLPWTSKWFDVEQIIKVSIKSLSLPIEKYNRIS